MFGMYPTVMSTFLQTLSALWRGELPLEVAFWRYAIYYGLIVNLAATTLSVVMLLNDLPIVLVVAVHLVPLPYSIVTAFGVWRSARRYDGPSGFATFARIGTIAWCCFWLFA